MSLSASNYTLWGEKLSKEYQSTGASMTEALLKLAREQQLNPDQIARVAEVANISTFQDLIPRREDFGGDPRFEKASSQDVIRALNLPDKVAADLSSYYEDPPQQEKTAEEYSRLLRHAFRDHLPELEAEMVKMAEEEKPPAATVENLTLHRMLLEKVAEELRLERTEISLLSKESLDEFKEIIERMVKEGGEDIMEIAEASVISRPDQKGPLLEIFASIISDFDRQGVFDRKKKEAGVDPQTTLERLHKSFKHVKQAEPLPPELLSTKVDQLVPKGFKVQWINGKHPITLSVNILGDLLKQRAVNEKAQEITNRRLSRLRDYILNLREQWNLNQTGEELFTEVVDKAKPVKTQIGGL